MSDTDRPARPPGGIAIEWPRIVLPVATLALGILAWDLAVRINDIPPFILPGPGLVAATLAADWTLLWDCLLYTSPSPRDGLLSRMPSSA